ncbi:MAG: tyrosine-type recombinase/integrase [Burkholderiales bacterium]|nr:tyrosine-type recombinase/integrase [Burkholderiales bacterium]
MLLKLGIENLHFHDLRHEAVSRLFELGSLDMMEIASISGHKSLSMLKRYTHLRAQRLVSKLEAGRHKGRQHVLGHLVPYPALVEPVEDAVRVRVLDFDDLVVSAVTSAGALELAQDRLLRRILQHMRESTPIPAPDQYLIPVDEAAVVWVDPMANCTPSAPTTDEAEAQAAA